MACGQLKAALAACEKAVAGRCPETAKACDRHREKWRACENKAAHPNSTLPGSTQIISDGHPAACGKHHCVYADALGAAFSWARDHKAVRFGALGWGRDREKSVEIQQAQRMAVPSSASAIVEVAAGDAHTALVDKDGALFMCGSDRWLQLGQDAFWSKGHVWQREPTLVASLQRNGVKVVSAACGADHTLALDTEGRVWGFGYGEHGQLFGDGQRPFTSPPTISAALSLLSDGGAAKVWAHGHCSCALGRVSGLWKCYGKCANADPA